MFARRVFKAVWLIRVQVHFGQFDIPFFANEKVELWNLLTHTQIQTCSKLDLLMDPPGEVTEWVLWSMMTQCTYWSLSRGTIRSEMRYWCSRKAKRSICIECQLDSQRQETAHKGSGGSVGRGQRSNKDFQGPSPTKMQNPSMPNALDWWQCLQPCSTWSLRDITGTFCVSL